MLWTEQEPEHAWNMKTIHLITALAAATATSLVANATTIHTSEADFLDAIELGYFLNDFNDLGGYGYIGTSKSYSSGGFSYTITGAGGGLYKTFGAISTLNETDVLTLTFTSGNVTAVGAKDFLTNYDGYETGGQVRVTLSDGTSVIADSPSFVGFTTTGAFITSLEIISLSTGDDQHYPSIDHLYVGTAVPEGGSTLAMFGLGLLGMLGLMRRTRG